ncbi:hypothetical protein OENI_20090 [Oenococcus oeni]|nr:hypothetical protein OENI_20090 [Oenococcus oeni]
MLIPKIILFRNFNKLSDSLNAIDKSKSFLLSTIKEKYMTLKYVESWKIFFYIMIIFITLSRHWKTV